MLFDAVLVKCSLLAIIPRSSINLILVFLNTRNFPVQDAGLFSSVGTLLNSGFARLDVGLYGINHSFVLCIGT